MITTTDTMTIETPTAYAMMMMRSLSAVRSQASLVLQCNDEKAQQRIDDAYARLSVAQFTNDACSFDVNDRELLTIINAIGHAVHTDTDMISISKIRSIYLQLLRTYHDLTPNSLIA